MGGDFLEGGVASIGQNCRNFDLDAIKEKQNKQNKQIFRRIDRMKKKELKLRQIDALKSLIKVSNILLHSIKSDCTPAMSLEQNGNVTSCSAMSASHSFLLQVSTPLDP